MIFTQKNKQIPYTPDASVDCLLFFFSSKIFIYYMIIM